MPSLHISNVSYALLEHQRLTLGTIDQEVLLTDVQMEAIDGILNMLDDWSDTEYYMQGKQNIIASSEDS